MKEEGTNECQQLSLNITIYKIHPVLYLLLIWICSFGPCPDFYANCNVPKSAHGKNVYNYCTLEVAIIMLLCCPIFINCKLYYRPNMPESRRDACTSALADYRIDHFCHISSL